VAVVGGVAGAVGKDQRALPASARPPCPLGVIGWVGRCIAQVDHTEATDIDAQLHGGGTKQRADLPLAEQLLPLDTGFGAELTGMVLSTQSFGFGKVALVKGLEELIGPW